MPAKTAVPAARITTCYQCTVNCPFEAELDAQGNIINLNGPECARGLAQMDVLNHPDRLLTPLKRVGPKGDGSFEPISWEEALDVIAGALKKVRDKHGAQQVAFVAGYTKECRPFLQRLALAFGSPNYMTESSCCFSATAVAASLSLGVNYDYFVASSRQNHETTGCFLVWSNNPSESQLGYEQHWLLRNRSRRLIVVDPRRTPLAERADVHLQIRPGSDGALALGLHHVLFREGLVDHGFLAHHAKGVEAFQEYVVDFAPARVAEICRIPALEIERAARTYAEHAPARLVISPSATVQHTNGFQNHRAILLLAAVTGNLDRPGGNVPFIPRAKPLDVSLYDERGKKLPPRLGEERYPVWTRHYREAQAMLLPEAILSGTPQRVRSVFAIGMNLMMWPDSRRMARALAALDFFACSDYFHTPTTRLADIVLPAATSLEREALITWGTGHCMLRQRAVSPRGEARGDIDTVLAVGVALGLGDKFWNGNAREAFKAQASCLEGVSFQQLLEHPAGVNIPLTPSNIAQQEIERRFLTASGKVEFCSEELKQAGYDALPAYHEPAESPLSTPDLAETYPLILTSGGRSRYFTHSQHRNIASLLGKMPVPRLEIHPSDAKNRNIRQDDLIELRSPRGAIRMHVLITDAVQPGVVHAPHGWQSANVNELISGNDLDPISGFPGFKSSLCQVAKTG